MPLINAVVNMALLLKITLIELFFLQLKYNRWNSIILLNDFDENKCTEIIIKIIIHLALWGFQRFNEIHLCHELVFTALIILCFFFHLFVLFFRWFRCLRIFRYLVLVFGYSFVYNFRLNRRFWTLFIHLFAIALIFTAHNFLPVS